MNKILSFIFFVVPCILIAQEQTNNYELIYHQDFSDPQAMMDFEFTDPSAWSISSHETNKYLSLDTHSIYEPVVRSPLNIAWLTGFSVGDFVLELRMAQTGREYGHRDLCVFFGGKDPSNFYYVHMASVTDDHANNIFIVNDAPRRKISTKTTEGTKWGATDLWHDVKIERNIQEGSIKVYFDHELIMEAIDSHFTVGHIGIGSFDDSGRMDDIKIKAPDFKKSYKSFFR